ncbi:MAG: hypothetical protein D6806_05425, partial [Deltaproteobacteria bacterium]
MRSLVVLVALVLLALAWLTNSPVVSHWMCGQVKKALNGHLSTPVRIRHCELSVVPPAVTLQGLEIGSAGRPAISVGSVKVELDSLKLMGGRLGIDLLRVERPEVHFAAGAGGRPALDFGGSKTHTGGGSGNIDRVMQWIPENAEVRAGLVDVNLGGGRNIVIDQIEVDSTRRGDSLHLEGAMRASFSNGEDTFMVEGTALRASLSPAGIDLQELRIKSGKDRLSLSADMSFGKKPAKHLLPSWWPEGLSGRADMVLSAELGRLRKWMGGTENWPEMKGRLELKASLDTTRRTWLKAELDCPRLEVGPLRDVSLLGLIEAESDRMLFKRWIIEKADSVLAIDGRLKLDERLAFNAHVKLDGFEYGSWVGWFVPLPVDFVLDGGLSLKGRLGPEKKPVMDASFELDVRRLELSDIAKAPFLPVLPKFTVDGMLNFAGRLVSWKGRVFVAGSEAVVLDGKWEGGRIALRAKSEG